MEKINKVYTSAFAEEMLNKINAEADVMHEFIDLRKRIITAIKQSYSSYRGYGGGLIQSEKTFVNHVWNSMNALTLEYTDFNIFSAACAMCSVMCDMYYGMQGFPMVPDVSNYNSSEGIAELMNKIVAYYNGDY